MAMKITQDYMNSEVINPMARRLAYIEEKVDKILLIMSYIDDRKPAQEVKQDKPKNIIKKVK